MTLLFVNTKKILSKERLMLIFHRLIQRLLCLELVQIDAFIFQCVEIPFHRGVVVRRSCFAHTLAYMDGFTEFHESL